MLLTVLLLLASPDSTEVFALTEPISSQCGTCYVHFGEGTADTEYELTHDTSFPLVVDIRCDESEGRRSFESAAVQFAGGVSYPVRSFNSSWAQLRLVLQPWQWGLVQLNLSEGCYYQRYLVAGRPPDDSINWSCSILLDGDSSKHCLPSGHSSLTKRQIVCKYLMTQLTSLTIGGELATKELRLRVQATHSFRSSTTDEQSNVTDIMTCTDPNDVAEGTCQTCWITNNFNNRDFHATTFIVTNLFGSASSQLSFIASEIVLLGKPQLEVYCELADTSRVKLHFFVSTDVKHWLCTSGRAVEYRMSVTEAFDDEEHHIETVTLPCAVCGMACNDSQLIADSQASTWCSCLVNMTWLRPATKYSYEAAWRPAPAGSERGAPWSGPALGTFDTPESVPAASPAMTPSGFEIHPCSAECELQLDNETAKDDCRAVTVYWKSIPLKERNGVLTGISINIATAATNHTVDVRSDRKNYTVCSSVGSDINIRVTSATAAGKPLASKWSIILIPSAARILPPVTQVIARAGLQSGSVQLWWYYEEPVDSFTIFWKNTGNHLHELNWTVADTLQVRSNYSGGRWNYLLSPSHRLNLNWPHNITYGIGATYRGSSTGLTFNSQCSTYIGHEAPAVEVLGKPVSGSTSMHLTIEAASQVTDACFFAGPLKGFELKLTDDSDTVALDATCDNCKLGVSRDRFPYRHPYSIHISNLAPNHHYGVAIRSVVDGGAMDVPGKYSMLVYARTTGLTGLEAFGVALAALALGCLTWQVARFLPQCHRVLGFGQKVIVRTIRPDNHLLASEIEAEQRTNMSAYTVTSDLLGGLTHMSDVGHASALADSESHRLLELGMNSGCESCSNQCDSSTGDPGLSPNGGSQSRRSSWGLTMPCLGTYPALTNAGRDDSYKDVNVDGGRSLSNSLPYLCFADLVPAVIGPSCLAPEDAHTTGKAASDAAHDNKVEKQTIEPINRSNIFRLDGSSEHPQQDIFLDEVPSRNYPDLGYWQASDIGLGVSFLDCTGTSASVGENAGKSSMCNLTCGTLA